MTFGGGNKTPSTSGDTPTTPKPPFAATKADSSVLMAGLMGLRPKISPALANSFNVGGISSSGLGRRPSLSKRAMLGGY